MTKTVCVTGMHRSGTSFAARALQILGVSLGDPALLMPPGPDNPAGYWEIRALKECNDDLLACLGGTWDQPPVLDPGWEDAVELDVFRDRAHEILAASFAEGATVRGFKDPRCSLLLPFWRTVVPIAATIVLVREPYEVAASLARRRQAVGPDQAALLWLRYLFAAIASDPEHLLVRQQDFFDDLDTTLDRIANHVQIAKPDGALRKEINAEFDPALHHRAPDTKRDDDAPLMATAAAVWDNGRVSYETVPPPLRHAIASGWLRAPDDEGALTKARAHAVELQAKIRQQRDTIVALKAEKA